MPTPRIFGPKGFTRTPAVRAVLDPHECTPLDALLAQELDDVLAHEGDAGCDCPGCDLALVLGEYHGDDPEDELILFDGLTLADAQQRALRDREVDAHRVDGDDGREQRVGAAGVDEVPLGEAREARAAGDGRGDRRVLHLELQAGELAERLRQ